MIYIYICVCSVCQNKTGAPVGPVETIQRRGSKRKRMGIGFFETPIRGPPNPLERRRACRKQHKTGQHHPVRMVYNVPCYDVFFYLRWIETSEVSPGEGTIQVPTVSIPSACVNMNRRCFYQATCLNQVSLKFTGKKWSLMKFTCWRSPKKL